MGFLGALSVPAAGLQSRKPSRPEAERACDTELTARAPHPPSRRMNITRWRQLLMVTVHQAIAPCSLIVKSLARAVRFLATASARCGECQSGAEPSEPGNEIDAEAGRGF